MNRNLKRALVAMLAAGAGLSAAGATAQHYGQPATQGYQGYQTNPGYQTDPGYQGQSGYGQPAAAPRNYAPTYSGGPNYSGGPTYANALGYQGGNVAQSSGGYANSPAHVRPVAHGRHASTAASPSPAGPWQPQPGYRAGGPVPTYQPPARWNQYRAVQNRTLDEADSLVENLPAPIAERQSSPSDRDLQLSSPERIVTPQAAPDAAPMRQAPQHHQVAPTYSYPSNHGGHQHNQQGIHQNGGHYSHQYHGGAPNSLGHGLVTEPTPHVSPYQSAMSVPHDQVHGGHPYQGGGYGGGHYGHGGCAQPGCASGSLGVRPQLYPWFASANVLFLNLENSRGNRVFRNYDWKTSLVDPGRSVGFDTQIGRYMGCGRYGLAARYFGWNPGREEVIREIPVATPADSSMPSYDEISFNDGTGQNTMSEHIDGRAGAGTGNAGVAANTRAAARTRLRRDLNFNSVELNLFSFGLMGAGRVAYAGCDPSLMAQRHGGRYGFGGAIGPLTRSNSPRVRVATSHGFRWFQAEDEFEYAYNVDNQPGYGDNDLYDNFRVENNLYGYQFGAFLTYCLGNRLNLNVGGKFGLYANDVSVDHRIGSVYDTAYLSTDNSNRIDDHANDTVLASLGELDLGLGYRIQQRAWTINGGYRLLGLSGVANAVDSYPAYDDPAHLYVDADNSYLIHGAYTGLAFNW